MARDGGCPRGPALYGAACATLVSVPLERTPTMSLCVVDSERLMIFFRPRGCGVGLVGLVGLALEVSRIRMHGNDTECSASRRRELHGET